jgi:hypothetical protein
MKRDIIKWITKGIRVSCTHKRALYTLVKNSSDDRLKSYYKRYYTILMRVIKEVKIWYYQKIASKSENKIQLASKVINKESGKKHTTDNRTELQMGESKLTNTKVAEEFNKYFITVTENLETKTANKNEAIKLLETLKYNNLPELRPIPTTGGNKENTYVIVIKKFYRV